MMIFQLKGSYMDVGLCGLHYKPSCVTVMSEQNCNMIVDCC